MVDNYVAGVVYVKLWLGSSTGINKELTPGECRKAEFWRSKGSSLVKKPTNSATGGLEDHDTGISSPCDLSFQLSG